MNLIEIRRFLRANPFQPSCIYVSDVSHYDIHHRDFILLSKSAVEIGIPSDSPEDFPEQLVSCDPLHLTRIEPIQSVKRRNGHRKKCVKLAPRDGIPHATAGD